jgi:hypothetical protein
MQSTAAHRLPSVNIHPGKSFALQLIPTPIAAVMAVALAAVHSNKKTVVYYELPRSTTSDARHSLTSDNLAPPIPIHSAGMRLGRRPTAFLPRR